MFERTKSETRQRKIWKETEWTSKVTLRVLLDEMWNEEDEKKGTAVEKVNGP